MWKNFVAANLIFKQNYFIPNKYLFYFNYSYFMGDDYPLKFMTKIGLEEYWFCNGNKRESIFYVADESRWTITSPGASVYSTDPKFYAHKTMNSLPDDETYYKWYPSGNIDTEIGYKNGDILFYNIYYDSPGAKSSIDFTTYNTKIKKNCKGKKVYYRNGNLQDSIILAPKYNNWAKYYYFSENGNRLEEYQYNSNKTPKSIQIRYLDYKAKINFFENGDTSEIRIEKLYKKKWCVYSKSFYENGQLNHIFCEKRFCKLFPSYCFMPDTLINNFSSYFPDGKLKTSEYLLTDSTEITHQYFNSGKLKSYRFFKYETSSGFYRDYSESGELIKEKYFKIPEK